MFKTTFRFFSFSILLLFGIILGISFAEHGIYKVVGDAGAAPKSLYVNQTNQNLEIKVLGKSVQTKIPIKNSNSQLDSENNKEDELNEKKVKTPFYSKLGNKLGGLLQIGTEKGLQYLGNLVK